MHLHTGTHVVEQLFGMSVNMDTIFTTWLTALIVFILVFAATRGKSLIPGGWQNMVEWLIEGLCNQFSVIKEKKLYGKPVRGIERSTFVIDGQGVLRKEWRGVKAPGHAQEVLDFIKTL